MSSFVFFFVLIWDISTVLVSFSYSREYYLLGETESLNIEEIDFSDSDKINSEEKQTSNFSNLFLFRIHFQENMESYYVQFYDLLEKWTLIKY